MDNTSTLYKSSSLSTESESKKDEEKGFAAVSTLPVINEEGNVGLSQFNVAKETGVKVSKEDNKR